SHLILSSRRRHTRFSRDWSSDVCSSDLEALRILAGDVPPLPQPRQGQQRLGRPDRLVRAAVDQLQELRGELDVPQSAGAQLDLRDRKSTRLNSSHVKISYAVFCLKKKTT